MASRRERPEMEVKSNRKEVLNRERGKQKFIDPEKGPENK